MNYGIIIIIIIIIITSKFVDAGSNNRNEIDGNYQHGMDCQRRMEKKNKTLGTERCANIDTLYINKMCFL